MINQNWYLGQMKFFDNYKGFGFVKEATTGQDYFVHISKIDTPPIDDNDRVVFKLTHSRKKQGTYEAKNVSLLLQFKSDTDFLISQFPQLKDFHFRKAILKALPKSCVMYLIEQEIAKQNNISNDIEYKNFVDKVVSINKQFEDVLTVENISNLISKYVEETISDNYKVQLWLDNIIQSEPELILIRNYFTTQKRQIQERIFIKLSKANKSILFQGYINKNNLTNSLNNLMIFLQLEKQVDIQKEFIYYVIVSFSNEKNNLEESRKAYGILINLISELEKTVSELLISFFYTVSADYIKLKMWLSDLIYKEDYDIYHSNFIFLDTSDQQRFIKKLFHLFSQNANGITYESISALKNLTHTFSEGKIFQLDFSCNIILESIDSVKNGRFLTEESIFSILTKHVENDTASLLSLNGFFEKCTGRSIPDITRENEDGTKAIVSLKKIQVPRNIELCEGVRFNEDGKDRTFNMIVGGVEAEVVMTQIKQFSYLNIIPI